jgi:hypothetical protein
VKRTQWILLAGVAVLLIAAGYGSQPGSTARWAIGISAANTDGGYKHPRGSDHAAALTFSCS